jgi:hypothetical protein
MIVRHRNRKPTVGSRCYVVPNPVVPAAALAILMLLPGYTRSGSAEEGPGRKAADKRDRGSQDGKEKQPSDGKESKKEEPAQPSESPAGGWERAAIQSPDGSGMVIPRLTFALHEKPPMLYVGAELDLGGSKKVSKLTRYKLTLKSGDRAELAPFDQQPVIEIQYMVKGDTLTVVCKQKLQAGKYLMEYDINGQWKRAK